MMFQSVSIKNFRGFQDFRLEGLERFNLLLGRNNAGKTSILEAMFLLLGPTNPQLTLTINAFRGIEQYKAEADDLWGWLFYDKQIDKPIVLEAKLRTGKRRTLTIKLGAAKTVRLPKAKAGGRNYSGGTASTDLPPGQLTFDLAFEGGDRVLSKAILRETSVSQEKNGQVELPSSVFVPAKTGYSHDNPERYSKLEETQDEHSILPFLQYLEPRLKRLTVLVTGAGPVLHGNIGLSKLIPLPMMGEGIGRLLTLLLAIVESKGGMVLIDEIEVGFHYSVLKNVWLAVIKAARQFDVQLFATTHSWECLKAANEAFDEQRPYDFAAQRMDVDKLGRLRSTVLDEETIVTARKSGMELR